MFDSADLTLMSASLCFGLLTRKLEKNEKTIMERSIANKNPISEKGRLHSLSVPNSYITQANSVVQIPLFRGTQPTAFLFPKDSQLGL